MQPGTNLMRQGEWQLAGLQGDVPQACQFPMSVS